MDISSFIGKDNIDLSFIGKEGLLIQYEDVVSLIGFNIIKYLRSKNMNSKMSKMSIEDILLNYLNRDSEDIGEWLSKEFDINNFNIDDFKESINTFAPNLLYSFKIFDTAYRNGIKKLMIYSNFYSSVIEKYLQFYELPIEYVYGNIEDVLNKNMNCTYITSSVNNIRKCSNVKTPFALTIVDDFMYVAPILTDGTVDKLRANNIFVQFTGIISGGFIKDT